LMENAVLSVCKLYNIPLHKKNIAKTATAAMTANAGSNPRLALRQLP